MEKEVEIKKVLGRKDGVKMVIIPKKSIISVGDLVQITKYGEVKDGKGRDRKED